MFHDSQLKPATANQYRTLKEIGFNISLPLSSQEANALITENYDKWRRLPMTEGQVRCLRKLGKWRPNLTRGEASDLIAAAKASPQAPGTWPRSIDPGTGYEARGGWTRSA
jgi:hypothetical protein